MALAGVARPARRDRARRRHAAGRPTARTPARCSRSARATRTASSRSRKPPTHGLPRLRHRPAAAASSSARRRPRRWSPRRSGCPCRTPRSRRRVSRSGSTWRGARRCALLRLDAARHDGRATSSPTPRSRNAMLVHAAFGGSTNLLLHIPAIARTPGCARRPSTTGSASNRARPAPGGRAAERPAQPPDGARVPGRRRARGDAAPAPAGPARRLGAAPSPGEPLGDDLDWWEASERAPRLRERLRDADGVDPDDVIMPPAHGPARAASPARSSSRAATSRRDGSVVKSTAIDPERRRRRRRLPPPRPGARLHHRARRDARDQGRGVEPLRAGRRAGAGRPSARWAPAWRRSYQVTIALKLLPWGKHVARAHRRPLLGRLDRAVHRAHQPRGAGGRPDRAAARRRPRRASSSTATRSRARSTSSASTAAEHARRRRRGAGDARRCTRRSRRTRACPTTPASGRLLQAASGGTWGGCVYDVDAIADLLAEGLAARARGTAARA